MRKNQVEKLFKPTADQLRIYLPNLGASFHRERYFMNFLHSDTDHSQYDFLFTLQRAQIEDNKSKRIDAHSQYMLITYLWLNLIR